MRLRFFNTFEPVSPLFRDLFPYLTSKGHFIEVIISDAVYRPGELRIGQSNLYYKQMPCKKFLWGYYKKKKVLIHFFYSIFAMVYSFFSKRSDLNVFMTQPPLFIFWGYMLLKIRRQPYSCVIMDLYPWVAIQSGFLKSDGKLTKIFKLIAFKSLMEAESIVVIGRCMAEFLAEIGIEKTKISIIPNWANTDIIFPVPPRHNDSLKKNGLKGKFIIMYSGNMGKAHYFDDIIMVAERLINKKDIVFLFVGNGIRLLELKKEVKKKRLSNVVFLGYQKYNELSKSLSMGDIHFITLREGFEGLLVPSKAYGIFAVGRPIIYQGNSSGEIARVVSEENIGMVVNQNDINGLERFILQFYQNPNMKLEMGLKANRLSKTRFDMNWAITKYSSILTKRI